MLYLRVSQTGICELQVVHLGVYTLIKCASKGFLKEPLTCEGLFCFTKGFFVAKKKERDAFI